MSSPTFYPTNRLAAPHEYAPHARAVGATSMRALIALGPVEAGSAAHGLSRGTDGVASRFVVTRTGAYPLKPAAFGSGTDIQPATTNLVTNPAFAVDTTGWGTGGTNTIVRTTALLAPLPYADFGTATTPTTGAVCTYQDNAFLATFNITLTAAAHSSSIYLYIPSTYDGTQLVWSFGGFTGATGTISVNADMTKTDQWQRVKVPNVTIAAGDLAGTMALSEAGTPTAGKSVTVTAMQIEALAYSTPYADGSLGDGFSWTGTANASTSQRALTSLTLPVGLANLTQGAVSAWVTPYDAPSGSYPRVFSLGSGSSNYLAGLYSVDSSYFFTQTYDGSTYGQAAASAGSFAAGTPIFVYFGWDASHVYCSVNGGAKGSAGKETLNAPTALRIGAAYGGTQYFFDGIVSHMYIWDHDLTDAEVQVAARSRWLPFGWPEIRS